MKRILSFGSYIFPDTQDQLSDNFKNPVLRNVRLPGVPGGFDEFGLEPAPNEIGSVKLHFLLLASTAAEITAKRDAVHALAGWGMRKVVVQPADPSLSPRYTYARIQNVQTPENAKKLDTWQDVTMDINVTYPFWMQDAYTPGATWGVSTWGSSSAIWGDSAPLVSLGTPPAARKWGHAAAIWGGSASLWGQLAEATLIYTNNGNAISQPRLIFTCTAEASSGLTIERLMNGAVKEHISFTGAIAAGQILDINCRSLSVTLDGASAYSTFSYTHPAWLRFRPGANTLRVTLPVGQGTLRVVYPHTWY
jgi:hypothetical protein